MFKWVLFNDFESMLLQKLRGGRLAELLLQPKHIGKKTINKYKYQFLTFIFHITQQQLKYS